MSLTKEELFQFFESNKKLMKDYYNDVEADKKEIELWIQQNEDKVPPFIHIVKEYDTFLTILQKAEAYPKEGELVKYLFSEGVDRWHLLKARSAASEVLITHRDYYVNQKGLTRKQAEESIGLKRVTHYDGSELKEINLDHALRIVHEYQRDIAREFNKEKTRRRDRESVGYSW